MNKAAYFRTKRVFDITVSLAGLIVLSPVIAASAAAIIAEDGAWPFFKQRRVGKLGKPFDIIKLRTMRMSSGGPEITLSGDERVTNIGKFLRTRKIDELPQLINVLSGDMSIVGPRPEVPRYVDFYTSEQLEVLKMRPGLTDPASLKFWDEAARICAIGGDPEDAYIKNILKNKLELSILYQRHATLISDIKIIMRTFMQCVSIGRKR